MDNIHSIVPEESSVKLSLPPISAAAEGPLYEQIVRGIKHEIGEGRLHPGQPLPSFRALAEDLLVSLITVKRAYEDLEREGLIYRKQGLGTFVSPHGTDRVRKAKAERAEELIREAVREAREAGLTLTEINRLVQQILKEKPQTLRKSA